MFSPRSEYPSSLTDGPPSSLRARGGRRPCPWHRTRVPGAAFGSGGDEDARLVSRAPKVNAMCPARAPQRESRGRERRVVRAPVRLRRRLYATRAGLVRSPRLRPRVERRARRRRRGDGRVGRVHFRERGVRSTRRARWRRAVSMDAVSSSLGLSVSRSLGLSVSRWRCRWMTFRRRAGRARAPLDDDGVDHRLEA